MIPTAHPSPQPKRHPYQYSCLCTDDRKSVPILYNGTPILPPKFAPSHGRSGPPSNIWFPGSTQVLNLNGSSIGAAVFAGLTSVTDQQTDRPTDHATRSVTIGRICVRSTAMRPKNYRNAYQQNNAMTLMTIYTILSCHMIANSEDQMHYNYSTWQQCGET